MKLRNAGGVVGFVTPLLVVAIFGGTIYAMPFWAFAFVTFVWSICFPHIFFELNKIKDEVDFFYYFLAMLGLVALTASHLDEESYVAEVRVSELKQLVADLDSVLEDPRAFLSSNDVRTRMMESLTTVTYYRSNPTGALPNCDLHPRQTQRIVCEALHTREGYASRLHTALSNGTLNSGLHESEIAKVFEGSEISLFYYPDMLFDRSYGVSALSIFQVYLGMENAGTETYIESTIDNFAYEVLLLKDQLGLKLASAEQHADEIGGYGKPDRIEIVFSRVWAFLLLIALGLKVARNKVWI